MTDFYLVTGFLGAGKTTFLKQLLPLFSGRSIRILINEFGKEGIDGALLAETGAALSEISGGSIFCSCRLDRFEEALIQIMETPPEVLVVETSGLSDPTPIHHILGGMPTTMELCYKGCICLVDAARLEKVFSTARVCPRQLAISDLVLINKTDLATEAQLAHTRQLVAQRCPLAVVHETCHGMMKADWLSALEHGRNKVDEAGANGPDITLQRAYAVLDASMTAYELERFLALFAMESCRIKGIVRLQEGAFLVDCVGALLSITPWQGAVPSGGDTLNILATAGMSLRKSLNYAVEWYRDKVKITWN